MAGQDRLSAQAEREVPHHLPDGLQTHPGEEVPHQLQQEVQDHLQAQCKSFSGTGEHREREFIIYTVIYQYVGEIVKGGLDYVENIIVHFKNIL